MTETKIVARTLRQIFFYRKNSPYIKFEFTRKQWTVQEKCHVRMDYDGYLYLVGLEISLFIKYTYFSK